MDIKDEKIAITESRQLIPINGELETFKTDFSVTSNKGEPFKAIVISQSILDSLPDEKSLELRDVPKGIFSGTITENSGKKDIWYIAYESATPIEGKANIHTEYLEPYKEEENAPAAEVKAPGKKFPMWLIILIIGAVLLLGFILYKFVFAKKERPLMPKVPSLRALTPAYVEPAEPVEILPPPAAEQPLKVDFSDLIPI